MKHLTLSDAESIYNCGNLCTFEQHLATNTDFWNLCLMIQDFKQALAELKLDPYWKRFLSVLGRYRFNHLAAPLPFDHDKIHLHQDLIELRRHLSSCNVVFPEFAKPAMELVDVIFSQISSSSDNPLLEIIRDIQNSKNRCRTAILLKEARLVPVTREILSVDKDLCWKDLNWLEVVGVNGVQSAGWFERLIVIGPCRWFPHHIFNAPRVSEIAIVRYSGMMDTPPLQSIFVGSSDEISRSAIILNDLSKKDIRSERIPQIDPDELVPSISWDRISHRFVDRQHVSISTNEIEEEAEARLYVLDDGNSAVYLDIADESKTTIIDLERQGMPSVKRVSTQLLSTDTFILLRTSGGSDYLVPKADQLLGDHASDVRAAQKRWKLLLQEAVKGSSMTAVIETLLKNGSLIANVPNLRNWMSYRSIKTEDKHDFNAIMSLVGLSNESDEYWHKMSMIDSAHRSAGHLIRQMLLGEVLAADLDQLEKLGRMEFELPDSHAGSLTAFRIQQISPDTYLVPVSYLGHVFDIEEDLWQG